MNTASPPVAARLLVVDDDLPVREILSEYLAVRGFRVETATDGREALERLRGGGFDAVISDLRLPGLDGLSLLRRCRELGLSLPFVMMTGYGTVETAVQALKLGASDFLLKPFKLQQVYDAVVSSLAELGGAAVQLDDLERAAATARTPESVGLLLDRLLALLRRDTGANGAAIYLPGELAQGLGLPAASAGAGWARLRGGEPSPDPLEGFSPATLSSLGSGLAGPWSPPDPALLFDAGHRRSPPRLLLLPLPLGPGLPQGFLVAAWSRGSPPEKARPFLETLASLASGVLARLASRHS